MAFHFHSRLVVVLVFLAGALFPSCCSFPSKDDGDNEYEPPQFGQVRSPCPAINAAANHGYIDRSGKSIKLQDLAQALDDVFGIPASLLSLIYTTFPLLGIPTETTEDGEVIDLDILFTHYGLEHDASMVREDLYFAGDRAPFSQELFDQCFVKKTMTVWALAACNRSRILDSRKTNPQAEDDINLGGLISALETSAMMFFGDSPLMIEGSKDDFESFLKFGRIPDGYHRRSLPELAAAIIPLSVTVPSSLKALKIPVKKPDGSTSSSEVPDNLISIFKTLAADYSSAFPKPFVAFVEAMLAELEQ